MNPREATGNERDFHQKADLRAWKGQWAEALKSLSRTKKRRDRDQDQPTVEEEASMTGPQEKTMISLEVSEVVADLIIETDKTTEAVKGEKESASLRLVSHSWPRRILRTIKIHEWTSRKCTTPTMTTYPNLKTSKNTSSIKSIARTHGSLRDTILVKLTSGNSTSRSFASI